MQFLPRATSSAARGSCGRSPGRWRITGNARSGPSGWRAGWDEVSLPPGCLLGSSRFRRRRFESLVPFSNAPTSIHPHPPDSAKPLGRSIRVVKLLLPGRRLQKGLSQLLIVRSNKEKSSRFGSGPPPPELCKMHCFVSAATVLCMVENADWIGWWLRMTERKTHWCLLRRPPPIRTDTWYVFCDSEGHPYESTDC